MSKDNIREVLREALRIAKARGRLTEDVIRFAEDVGAAIDIE